MLFTIDCIRTFGFTIPEKYKTECFKSLYNLKNTKV